MNTVTVSIIIPAYRHQDYIEEAIHSVLAQTQVSLELIVIDDASPDQTWERIEAIKDKRIRAYRNQHNLGAHASINRGLNEAEGDYLCILNSDDYFHPERLSRLLELAKQQDTEDFFAFTDVVLVDDTETARTEQSRITHYEKLKSFCIHNSPSQWFLAGNPALTTSNFFFSRSILEKTGPFLPLRYTHDWDWAVRASTHCQPTWLHEPLLNYRIHASNTLSEGDLWRHIHENAYIQSHAILACKPESPEPGFQSSCLALLNNDSFHPLPLLCYLHARIQGSTDEELLALTTPSQQQGWWLEQLAKDSGMPTFEAFRSLPHLLEQFATIPAQQRMIDERWQTIQNMEQEIVRRDEANAAITKLVDERWHAIQEMGAHINERDVLIRELTHKQDEMHNQHIQLSEKYENLLQQFNTLNATRAVRIARFIRKYLPAKS